MYVKKIKRVKNTGTILLIGAGFGGMAIIGAGAIGGAFLLLPFHLAFVGVVLGGGAGVGTLIGIDVLVENHINPSNSFEAKIADYKEVVVLLESDVFVTSEEIRKNAENRYLKDYNAQIDAELIARNKLLREHGLPEITREELQKEFPAELPYPFEKRNLNKPAERTMVDVLAGIKGIHLTRSSEYHAFRERVEASLSANTSICKNLRHMYRMKQIADEIQ